MLRSCTFLVLTLLSWLAGGPAAAGARDDCAAIAAIVDKAPVPDSSWAVLTPCPGLAPAAIDRRIAEMDRDPAAWLAESGDTAEDLAEERAALLALRPVLAAKALMHEGNRAGALAELLKMRDPGDPESWNPWVDRETLLAILSGQGDPGVRPAPAAPEIPWVLDGFTWTCGTARYHWMIQHMAMPGEADAWLALGRTDLALSRYLDAEWLRAAADQSVPLRLREFAERHYGEAGATQAFETALAGIRIEQGPLGRSAQIPLFGRWLPLPVGQKQEDWAGPDEPENEETAAEGALPVAWTEDQLAESLRRSWNIRPTRIWLGSWADEAE